MNNYNERDARPAERITVAGIAAIVVVAVFVVCVVLILAKSLFPSNDNSVPDGEYTGTKPAQTTTVAEPEQVIPDTTSSEEVEVDLNTSGLDDSSEGEDDSVAEGEVAYLTQTAYLRAYGDENADIYFSINGGESVTVLERDPNSEHVKVDYYGTEGYIWYGYLGY